MAYDQPDNNPFSERNQRAHIQAHFSSVAGEAPTSYIVSFNPDETIAVQASDAEDMPWIYQIGSDDDDYQFVRGNVTISFPYPEEL